VEVFSERSELNHLVLFIKFFLKFISTKIIHMYLKNKLIKIFLLGMFILSTTASYAQSTKSDEAKVEAMKSKALQIVESKAKNIQEMVDMVFSFGELGFQEIETSKYLTGILEKNGFVIDGDFMFKANRHDNGIKQVLGIKYDSRGGYNEGLTLISRISKNPNTAKFICKKIATKFVSDTPEDALIDKMSKTFMNTNGNLRDVLITMVNSTYFWDGDAVRKKIKNPFELTISAIRATNSKVLQPYQIFNWCNTMGQKFYYYQAPTGFPDRSDYWVNTNSLINRMNFGISISSGKIPGLFLDPNLINFKVEPESIDSAINLLSYKLLPESSNDINNKRILRQYTVEYANNKSMNLSNQILGLLIGSPEFQKK
jgi:hypothetical protein